jgi:hypothetical protein
LAFAALLLLPPGNCALRHDPCSPRTPGGTVRVEDSEPSGARFIVDLPRPTV